MSLTLRPYQERIVSSIINELNHYSKPFIVDSFQASGKSLMIAELVRRLGEPVLILCMNKELVEQDRDKLVGQGVDATMYSASAGEKIISDVTVGTINSLYTHPEFCERFSVVIVDEADQLPCDNPKSMYMKLLSKIKVKVVGLTGTAFRMVKRFGTDKSGAVVYTTQIRALNRIPMEHGFFWGKIIHGISYKELLDEKYVAPIQYYIQDTDRSMLRVNSTGADYTEDSLEDYGKTNRAAVADTTYGAYLRLKPKRILVTVPNIEDAEAIAEMLKDKVSTAVLHSKLPKKERTRIVNEYKEGFIRVVVQVMMLNVGFDLPALDVVVFARPCLSLRIWCQTVARGIRLDPYDEDKVCKIIDMSGMIKQFGRIEDVRIDKEEGGFRSIVRGTYGVISEKVLSEVNIAELHAARPQKIVPKLYN